MLGSLTAEREGYYTLCFNARAASHRTLSFGRIVAITLRRDGWAAAGYHAKKIPS